MGGSKFVASSVAGKAVQLISDEPAVKKAAQGSIIVKTMEEFLAEGFTGAENNPKTVAKSLFEDSGK
jgi:hypothetical protein